MLDDLELHAAGRCRIGGGLARVDLVDEGNLDILVGQLLKPLGQFANLGSLLILAATDDHHQQITERINGDMHPRAVLPLRPVVAGPVPAFRRRAKRAAIENDRRRLLVAVFERPFAQPQFMGDLLEDACLLPAAGLLVDRLPGRQVVGHTRQGHPARTMYRTALKTFRSG